ncbi:MAG: ribonuclease R [Helicobacter sp.]|nr:ribonuclease R [Helicobacter sp.]
MGYLCTHQARLCVRHIKTGKILPVAASQKSLRVLPQDTLFLIKGNTILSVLGHISDSDIDEKIILATLPHHAFSPDVMRECASFAGLSDSLASMYPRRLDLSHLCFCTIDPIDAKDFDDAICYDSKTGELFVAIADVSEFVATFSALDKAARTRAFSLYLPHKCVPMLPPILSEELCSLVPHKKRLALVWKFRLHRGHGKVLRKEYMLAIIESKARLNYDEVDEILQRAAPQTDIESMLLALFAQTARMRKRRLKSGYDFNTIENHFLLDGAQNLLAVRTSAQSAAHSLVEESMLLANIASAETLEQHFETALYRTHRSPIMGKLRQLFGELYAFGYDTGTLTKSQIHARITAIQRQANRRKQRGDIDRIIIKSFAQARYAPTSSKHFGLGFECYTHFTSPIRRYVDLCVHRLLKAALVGKRATQAVQNIDVVCDSCNTRERELAGATLDYCDRIYARAAQRLLGNVLEATVMIPAAHNLPAVLRADSVLVGARLFAQQCELPLLAKVHARIDSVNLMQARIDCTILGEQEGAKRARKRIETQQRGRARKKAGKGAKDV